MSCRCRLSRAFCDAHLDAATHTSVSAIHVTLLAAEMLCNMTAGDVLEETTKIIRPELTCALPDDRHCH
jgi:hypothetical protein